MKRLLFVALAFGLARLLYAQVSMPYDGNGAGAYPMPKTYTSNPVAGIPTSVTIQDITWGTCSAYGKPITILYTNSATDTNCSGVGDCAIYANASPSSESIYVCLSSGDGCRAEDLNVPLTCAQTSNHYSATITGTGSNVQTEPAGPFTIKD